MRRIPLTASLACVALVATAVPATAAPPARTPDVLVTGLAGPLSFDVGPGHQLVIGEAFSGAVTHVAKDGTTTPVLAPTGLDVAAVSRDGKVLTWAQTTLGEEGFPVGAVLVRRDADGTVRQIADLWADEEARNPDQVNTYGFDGLDAECAASLPPFLLEYSGMVDSHPYGSVTVGDVTYVADAGANTITGVVEGQDPFTVAVLPPTVVTITAEMAEAAEVPPCVVGHDFRLEPVPTDVELGHDGMLYVTTLPGGPEDGSLGANGSVYRVDPSTGDVELVATGFAGATGLAVGPGGTIYVAELFGGQVSAVDRYGNVSVVAELSMPAAVEYASGRLYVSTDVFGSGSIVSLHPSQGKRS